MVHSVINATFLGEFCAIYRCNCEVEPMLSATSWTSLLHSGCTKTSMPGCARRSAFISETRNSSCTMQTPSQPMISTSVCEATYLPRCPSGTKITFGTPSASTTFTALDEVQQISHSALTAAEVFT